MNRPRHNRVGKSMYDYFYQNDRQLKLEGRQSLQDYYGRLGLSDDASYEDVTQAYRSRIQQQGQNFLNGRKDDAISIQQAYDEITASVALKQVKSSGGPS
jgi:hypothetical protein